MAILWQHFGTLLTDHELGSPVRISCAGLRSEWIKNAFESEKMCLRFLACFIPVCDNDTYHLETRITVFGYLEFVYHYFQILPRSCSELARYKLRDTVMDFQHLTEQLQLYIFIYLYCGKPKINGPFLLTIAMLVH